MTEHKFGEWYPIEDLKEKEKDVLIACGGHMTVGYRSFSSGEIWNDCGSYTMALENIVGWMPLPPPPKEREK